MRLQNKIEVGMLDKEKEKRFLDSLYPIDIFQGLVACESPDFIYAKDGRVLLGVEVTEFFADETEARLHRLPNYGLSLLDGGPFRHKDDKDKLRIENVEYCRGGDKSKAVKLKAIVRSSPSSNELVEKLWELISIKSQKLQNYLLTAAQVDLVISDVVGATAVLEPIQIYRMLRQNDFGLSILKSQFREIFLIGGVHSVSKKCLQLLSQLFVEEVLCWRYVARTWLRGKVTDETRGGLELIILGLIDAGYGESLLLQKAGLCLVYRRKSVCFRSAGTHISDIEITESISGTPLHQLSFEIGTEIRKLFKAAKAERGTIFYNVDLSIEIKHM